MSSRIVRTIRVRGYINSYVSGISGDRADTFINFDVTGDVNDSTINQTFTLQTTIHALKYKASGTIETTYAP